MSEPMCKPYTKAKKNNTCNLCGANLLDSTKIPFGSADYFVAACYNNIPFTRHKGCYRDARQSLVA